MTKMRTPQKMITSNEVIVEALKDKKEAMTNLFEAIDSNILFEDDEARYKVNKFKDLPIFEQDVIYLISTGKSVQEIADLYSVTRQYIYKIIKKINGKLK